MCGRFSTSLTATDWQTLLKSPIPDGYQPSFNVCPTQRLLTFDGEAMPKVWSYLPAWAGSNPAKAESMSPVINARIETAAEKPYFRTAWKRGRIAIPATGFYEWQKRSTGKHPHHITLIDDEPFAFAGLDDGYGVAILTTAPNALMAGIHNRQPVILRIDQIGDWLTDARWPEIKADALSAVEVSTDVNNVRNNRPDLTQQISGTASETD